MSKKEILVPNKEYINKQHVPHSAKKTKERKKKKRFSHHKNDTVMIPKMQNERTCLTQNAQKRTVMVSVTAHKNQMRKMN